MFSNGWISLYRSLLEWKFSKNLEMMGFWANLLLMANHENGYCRDGELIKKGSFRTGRKILASRFGITESKVERMLKKLIKSGEIEQQTFTKYRVISIVNYTKYQSSGQQANNKRTTSEQQADTNNKNNKNNKNNNNNVVSEKESDVVTPERIVKGWNSIAAQFKFKKVIKLSPERKTKCLKAIKLIPSVDEWKAILNHIPKDKRRLNGSDEWEGANFDWLFRNENYLKMLEGAKNEN